MSDSANIFSQSYSDNTQTEVLANLPLNNLVLTQRSLENIVEVDELNMLLNERLSSFMTRAQVEELLKALIDKNIDIDQLIKVEDDPIFRQMSSTLMTKEEMIAYATKTWISNNFLSNNALNEYATLTETQAWANNEFMKMSALDEYAKKTDLPTNYLSTTAGKTNAVESKNKFKDAVAFDKTAGNGLQLPCISVNVDEGYHLNVDGSEYLFADDGMVRGPGKSIADDDLVKTHMSEQTESTVSTRILATRDWAERRFAHVGTVGGLSEEDLSTLSVPIKTTSTLTVEGNANFNSILANNISASNLSTQNFIAESHGLVGSNVNFSTGGDSVFVIGNNHSIYGKESFVAGNEGNIIGAKAFHWKAIDTTNNLIYLTSEKDKIKFNSTKLSSTAFLSGTSGNYVSRNEYRKYDIPYFGPKADADPAISAWLFTADTNLSILKENVQVGTKTILGAKGKQLILNNVFNEPYMRKLTVLSVINGSILSVSGLENIDDEYKQTHYRKNTTDQTYHANHYIACFPDVPLISTNSDVGCENNMTFGCAAIGEANNTIGYNSFAIGRNNTAEGNYSMAFGYGAKAKNNNSFAWSGGATYSVTGVGQFGINPNNGLSGFYISDKNFMQCVLSALNDVNFRAQFKSALNAIINS